MMLKENLNSLLKYSETVFKIAFPVLVIAAILTFYTFREDYLAGQAVDETHHKEVKSLVKQSLQMNDETKTEVKKVDKKVDNLSIEVKKGHTLYLKDIESNKRLIQSNEQFYKNIYRTMDTTAIDAVNRFNAEWFSKADSLKW